MTGKRKLSFIGIFLLAGYLSLGLAHYLLNKPYQPDSLRIDFEQQPWQEIWTDGGRLYLCCEHSATVVPGPENPENHALRFEVNRDDENVNGSVRAEIIRQAVLPGDDIWYQFSVWIPEDWKPSPVLTIFAQWHGVPDVLFTEYGRPPPMNFFIEDNNWRIVNRWDSKRITNSRIPIIGGGSIEGFEGLWSGDLERGVWTTWTVHAIWSYTGDGRLDIWKNGTHIAERRGPNNYNDVLGPFFTTGIYIPAWGKEPDSRVVDQRVLFVDNITINRYREALPMPIAKKGSLGLNMGLNSRAPYRGVKNKIGQ